MKKLILILLPIAFTLGLFSQTDGNNTKDKEETLIGTGEHKFGFYFGPEFKITQMNGEIGFMSGGRGGLVLDGVFSIGGGGFGLSTNHSVSDGLNKAYLEAKWGGAVIELIISPNKLVHYTFGALIGGGSASFNSSKITNQSSADWIYSSSSFFIFEPGLGAEVNIIKYFRVGFQASYRLIAGLDLPRTVSSDLGGFSLTMSLKLGTDDIDELIKHFKDK